MLMKEFNNTSVVGASPRRPIFEYDPELGRANRSPFGSVILREFQNDDVTHPMYRRFEAERGIRNDLIISDDEKVV